ncbi:multicopper oxidase domain-containing protein [Cryobacterium sp. Hh38]|uniref:multicopper oxidase domain-containing protein n=1 Tax=Cryobacterium sp. Hh38 TaxID=1259156 RepID=UPI003514F845
MTIAGRDVRALSYNGGVPGPTLRVRAGDTLNVSLRNGLADPSNLHVHGLHVSPENNSDNMFVTVAAGASFDYQYELPANHPPGVYWYHPHHHGFVADQVFGGLYGAIIVEDPDPSRPAGNVSSSFPTSPLIPREQFQRPQRWRKCPDARETSSWSTVSSPPV